ncbi:MAG: DUF2752 domain-containing protein [Planctomycetota bacterium]
MSEAAAPPNAPLRIDALGTAETRRRRAAALVVLLATGLLLAVAWWLEPSRHGFGTHRALGLPECSWPARFGVPCPSCGMTTAFALATKGRLLASFAAQPMGCLLAIATGMAAVGSAWTLATGRSVWPVFERMWTARAAWALGILALLAWGYKTASMRGWMG